MLGSGETWENSAQLEVELRLSLAIKESVQNGLKLREVRVAQLQKNSKHFDFDEGTIKFEQEETICFY